MKVETKESVVSGQDSFDEKIVPQKHSKITQLILGSKPQPIPTEPELSREHSANVFSKLYWSWLNRTIYTGYNRALEYNDIFLLDKQDSIEHLMDIVHTKAQEYHLNGSQVPHSKALLYTTRKYLFLCSFLRFAAQGSSLGSSLLANKLITSIELIYTHQQGYGPAVGYAIASLCLMLITFTGNLWGGYHESRYTEVMRNLLTALIYEKTMRLSSYGKAQYDPAAITSLVTVDTARVSTASHFIMGPVLMIPMFGAVIGVLCYFLGANALAGAGLILLGLFASTFAGKYISGIRKKSLKPADKRVSTVRETISSMRVLKLYGWEESFVKVVEAARKLEEKYIMRVARLNVTTMTMTGVFPYFAGVLTFAIMTVRGKSLTPAIAFPALTLFQMISPISQQFTQAVVGLADGFPCLQRIEQFMEADETMSVIAPLSSPTKAVVMQNFTAKWLKDLPKLDPVTIKQRITGMFKKQVARRHNAIEDISKIDTSKFAGVADANLEINKGELVMVVGAIGSGKSNLLNAIAANMAKVGGSLEIDGTVTPVLNNWCQNATVRENIIFGLPFDEKRYNEVVRVCELTRDFNLFENGDKTEIGEHGITLSGGQRARLALARGVYRYGEIILLDDVLSAVDSKVGKLIMENCIVRFMADKTRIMSTHNPVHLKYADRIIFVADGHMTVGTLEELESHSKFVEFMDHSTKTKDPKKDELTKDEDVEEEEQVNEGEDQAPEKLMSEESRTRGGVRSKIFFTYVKFSSKHYVLSCSFLLLLLAATGASEAMMSVFLNWWTSDKYKESNGFYIGIYASLVVAYAITSMLVLVFVSGMIFRATSNLLTAAVANTYRAPLSFFDTNPIGRIINRFTNDLAILDTRWYFQVSFLIPIVAACVAQFVLIFVYVPWAILCLIPLLGISLVSQTFYRYSSREINRLQSLFRGRQMGSITENIDGQNIVVGYGQQEFFRDRVFHATDRTISASIMNSGTLFWFASRALLSFLPTYFVVVMLCIFHVFHTSTSTVGMLLGVMPAASLSFVQLMLLGVEAEKNLNSIERLYEYAFELPQEAPQFIKETSPPDNWPATGQLSFENVGMRYREGLPLVLKGTSFTTRRGEKIGICGRTGAGKSSIIACLFRLNEIENGTISIDGVDISKIGLRDLRRKLSIIPQESILFEGTVRSNLDPFEEHNDAELQDTLLRSGATFKLDDKIEANGANFSLGERQLLALSRALVRRSKIIALDEATANVDHKTDAAIQKVLANEFADSTVICIAHRLQTILGYDRIIVMDAGRVAEFGTPIELWKFNGQFASLCREAGLNPYDYR